MGLQRIEFTERDQERWQKKVRKTDSCWFWTGRLDQKGYGSFRLGKKVERAHRVAYAIWNGHIPDGLQVRHICPGAEHHPHCVNPAHLLVGTAKENGEDKAALGTFKGVMSGEKNPRAKLSDAQVIEIHKRSHNGESSKSLSKEFGVTSRLIRMIHDGHTRPHLGLPVSPVVARGSNRKVRKRIRASDGTPPTEKEITRFRKKYIVREDDCWEWTACRDTTDYGVVRYRDVNLGAHRFSYLIANGILPPARDIAHSCANRWCVNPDHLSAKTRKQNMRNKKTRKRMSTHSGNRGNQRLTDEQIRQIKEIYRDEDVSDQRIVDRLELPVGAAALARIRKGQTGKHVVVEGFEPRTKGRK
jgi:hypothetical protein